jgi:hypothetical protein
MLVSPEVSVAPFYQRIVLCVTGFSSALIGMKAQSPPGHPSSVTYEQFRTLPRFVKHLTMHGRFVTLAVTCP